MDRATINRINFLERLAYNVCSELLQRGIIPTDSWLAGEIYEFHKRDWYIQPNTLGNEIKYFCIPQEEPCPSPETILRIVALYKQW